MTIKKTGSIAILILVIIPLLYTNCDNGRFKVDYFSDSRDLALNHPDEAMPVTSKKTLVVNRTYVATLAEEIFMNPAAENAEIRSVIDNIILQRGAQLGGACDLLDSNSSRDCGGSASNSKGSFYQDPSTLRETYRVQFCENILGVDAAVVNAVRRAGLSEVIMPDALAYAKIYSLFYRGREATTAEVNALASLQQELRANGVLDPLEIWRGLILIVCQSPDWQLI